MFFDSDIKGDRLPPKTLCLTYDDGPGPHTLELGRYLFEEGIRAAFFVIGRHAEGRGDVLARLKEWGHLVGNHTYSHPALVDLALAGGDVAAEVWRAHRVIEPYLPEGPAFFRPPYGNWRERVRPGGEFRPTSIVADRLNRDARLRNYVGPIKWEISGEDYDYWRRGAPAEEGAPRYLDEIDRAGRGIVLMHDSSDEELVRVNNRTFEMTRLLVPVLKDRGYRFVRLDSIPQVQSAMRV